MVWRPPHRVELTGDDWGKSTATQGHAALSGRQGRDIVLVVQHSFEGLLAVATSVVAGGLLTYLIAQRSPAPGAVVASYLARLALGFGIWAYFGFFSPDAVEYHATAARFAAYWSGDLALSPSFSVAVGKEGWSLILASIYYFVGPYPLLGIVFNAVASGISTALVASATVRLGWPQHARAAAWLTLMPAFLIWSSQLLRESLAWMLSALALWAGAGLVRKALFRDAVWLVLAVAGTLWIRGSLAAVILAGVIAGVVMARRRVPVPIVLTIAAGAVVGGPLLARLGTITGGMDIEQINAARRSLSQANSGFATAAYSSPGELITSLPSTLPRVLVGPYPWEIVNLPVVSVIDWAAWVATVWLAWRGWRHVDDRARWFPLVSSMFLLVAVAVTSGNYGTMARIRVQAVIFLLPLAAAGIKAAKPDREKRRREARPVTDPRTSPS